MTPKEKARKLVFDIYPRLVPSNQLLAEYFYGYDRFSTAKRLALITVEEVLESIPSYKYWDTHNDETPSAITYWNEVKDEIGVLIY